MGQGSIAQNLVVEAVAGQTLQPMFTLQAEAPSLGLAEAQAEVATAMMAEAAEHGVVTFRQLAAHKEAEVQAVLARPEATVAVTAAVLEAMPKMVGREDSLEVEAGAAVEL